jgi:CheY-like chemotaxis protein
MILIVEDDLYMMDTLVDLFNSEGLGPVTSAPNPTRAWQAFSDNRPDAIFLDIALPPGDDNRYEEKDDPYWHETGLVLARRLVQEGRFDPTRIVVLTVQDDDVLHGRLRDLGIKRILVKPCETKQIITQARSALRVGEAL